MGIGEDTPIGFASCPRRARLASLRSALQRMCWSLWIQRPGGSLQERIMSMMLGRRFQKKDLVVGTYPEGSAWRPVVKVEGRGKGMKYLIRKDKVKVPKNLPMGDYVLSFRWDAEWA